MKTKLSISILILIGMMGNRVLAVSIAIGHPSFENQEGTFITGLGNGWWTANGNDGGVWGGAWQKYGSSFSNDKCGPYQALNALYQANTNYILKFHARLDSGSYGKITATFMALAAGDAWYDGGSVGRSQTYVLPTADTEWAEYTLTFTTPGSGEPIGKNIVLNFSFPATEEATPIELDDVSLDAFPVSITGGQIAQGKSYTFSISPNYAACTNSTDSTDLTDGVSLASNNSPAIWLRSSTVGWDISQTCCPIQITIDLGSMKAISGVSFNTACAPGIVEWPECIFILTSDDGKNFEYIGDLVVMDKLAKGGPAATGYSVYKYETHDLQTHGRYVRLVMALYRTYTFVDEIEVCEGDPAWCNVARTTLNDLHEFIKGKMVTFGIRRTMKKELESLRSKVNSSSISSSIKSTITSELNAVSGDIPNVEISYSSTFRATLPFNSGQEQIFKSQALYWNALGCSGVRHWSSPLWSMISELDDPPSVNGASVSVDMMKNEYRAGAFNLSNATQTSKAVMVTIAGLPGGNNPSWISVHSVTWTDTQNNIPVAAALPTMQQVNGGYPLTLISGLTQQIWLTFHPTDIAAGMYSGTIQIRGDVAIDIPVMLNLRNCDFPDKPSLGFGGFDYVNNPPSWYAVNATNKASLLSHLQEHFVNSPWATSSVMPSGTFDNQGYLTVWPSTTNFNNWITDWPKTKADYYYVFLDCGDQIGPFTVGTTGFNTAVRSWINFWSNYIQNKGLSPSQFRLHLVDEPGLSHYESRILAWANAIHAANRGFKIWTDPCYSSYDEVVQDAMNACDILCPKRDIFVSAESELRDYYTSRQMQGIELQFYACAPCVRLLDPYAYHRLEAWICWKYGAKTMFFWSFGSAATSSSWNEYAGGMEMDYTPFFIDETSVTAGKHMEACREGVEDYEYLVILQNLILTAQVRGLSGDALTTAQNLLSTLPDQVLNTATTTSYLWSDMMVNRATADVARTQLLEAIVNLMAAMKIPGDANEDGVVDVGDLGILAANYGKSDGMSWAMGDFNGDGVVDVGDLGILAANYGKGTSGKDFESDYAKVFETTIADDEVSTDEDTNQKINSPVCSELGLSLIVGLFMMGLVLGKISDAV